MNAQTILAVLSVKGAATMTTKQRAAVANWLRGQAAALQSEGNNYAARFRARYIQTAPRTK